MVYGSSEAVVIWRSHVERVDLTPPPRMVDYVKQLAGEAANYMLKVW